MNPKLNHRIVLLLILFFMLIVSGCSQTDSPEVEPAAGEAGEPAVMNSGCFYRNPAALPHVHANASFDSHPYP